MESKSFSLKAIDDKGSGSAVIATLGVIDRDGDVILPGAFSEQTVVVLPAHDSRSVPLGKAVVSELGNEAIARFKFNQEVQVGKDWFSHLKFDLSEGQPVQEWSFRFDPIDESQGEFEGQKVRFLKKLKLVEVSPVLVGAGIDTRTLQIKARKDREAAYLEAEEAARQQCIVEMFRWQQIQFEQNVRRSA